MTPNKPETDIHSHFVFFFASSIRDSKPFKRQQAENKTKVFVGKL